MSYRSHEIPQKSSNDPRQLINRALAEGHLLYITYRDRDGGETKRKIKPLEWVEDYKIRAFCYLRQDERHFVLTGIREISLVSNPSHETGIDVTTNQGKAQLTPLDQWRYAEPIALTETVKHSQRQSSRGIPAERFSKIQTSEQWQRLISYYAECLNREFLQDYLIDQRGDYRFFPADEADVLRFLAGNASFSFSAMASKQVPEIAAFISDPSKRDQQLCLGYPSLLTPKGKIAPLFFVACNVEQQEGKIILRPEEYEISYAVVQSLDFDKDEFAGIVAGMGRFEFTEVEGRIKALENALVLKLEELTKNTIPRREANHSNLIENVAQVVLYTTPCLFWASKNNITNALIDELEEISKRAWSTIPSSLQMLLNIGEYRRYPDPVLLSRDKKVYVTPVNDEQRNASHAALTMPITVVTGPPGTGKSQLVANIIANAVLERKSVLFASRNNRAVDVVVARMNDIGFDGLIRTGSNEARKQSAYAMQKALSKAAMPHPAKDVSLLIERYRQSTAFLAEQINGLNEIRRLKSSLTSKLEQLETSLKQLPLELANFVRQDVISTGQSVIDPAKKLALALLQQYQTMQQRKESLETILQDHLVDNNYNYAIIRDIEVFEMEWGSFGDNIRGVNYYTSLEAMQSYIGYWVRVLTTVEARFAAEKASIDVESLQRKLNNLIQTLPSQLQLEVHSTAKAISKDRLSAAKNQIVTIDKKLADAQKSTISNWFGIRRAPQIKAILGDLNPLLISFGQPTFNDKPILRNLRRKHNTIKTYVSVIIGIRSLASKRKISERAEQELQDLVNLLSEKTQGDFTRLKLQTADLSSLKKVLLRVAEEIEALLNQRNETVITLRAHVNASAWLTPLWSRFENEVGGDAHQSWTFDSALSITLLQRFATQWLETLNAVEIKAYIEQIEATIRAKGGEEGAATSVNKAQKNAVEKAIEILNSTWLQNTNRLTPESFQRVRDYASLVRELSENYDKQKYASMMAIQESQTDDMIAAFPVWATTNLSIRKNLPLKAEMFDMVIIDEASQCDIPSALPLIYRAKQVIVIGDAMQLRHIATLGEEGNQYLADEQGVAVEAYSYTQHSLFDLASRSVGQYPGILLLKEHYRSHEDIIRFSNEAFYDGKLIVKSDLTNRRIPSPVLDNACGVYWINVAGNTIQPPSGSAKNLQEVDIIQRGLPLISQRLKGIEWESSIGVVTPYREQRNAIQRWVDAQFNGEITVGTAHTFQGDERDIMLFSTVLATGISDGSLAWLSKTENLLNVAVTRARAILIIVGDLNFCLSQRDNNPYKRLAEYVRSKPGRVIQSWAELPLLK